MQKNAATFYLDLIGEWVTKRNGNEVFEFHNSSGSIIPRDFLDEEMKAMTFKKDCEYPEIHRNSKLRSINCTKLGKTLQELIAENPTGIQADMFEAQKNTW